MQRILWVDNDQAYIWPQVVMLQQRGLVVDLAETVTEAEEMLAQYTYDLLILDVMIPVTESEERGAYPPELTEETHNTGLVFFKRHVGALNKVGTRIVILTVRIDDAIRRHFVSEGLDKDDFKTKLDMRYTPDFVTFVFNALAKPRPREGGVRNA